VTILETERLALPKITTDDAPFLLKLLNDPSLINTDNYDAGWLYEFETSADLLSPGEYVDLLTAGWEKTQQMIKGQMNE